MIIKKEILLFCIANTRHSVSLKLKLAVLGQNWEENNCLRHQNICAPLDGIDDSKAFDKTLLEVSAKKGEAKRKKDETVAQETQELCGMMKKLFGESLQYTISDELNKHLDKNHDCSNTWSDVKKFLGCHPDNVYPKEKLSKEQLQRFGCLRRNEIIRNKYNDLVERRKQFQKQEDEQLEQERQERQRLRRQDMCHGFYR